MRSPLPEPLLRFCFCLKMAGAEHKIWTIVSPVAGRVWGLIGALGEDSLGSGVQDEGLEILEALPPSIGCEATPRTTYKLYSNLLKGVA